MSINWTDINEIAVALYEEFPAIDPQTVRFTDLRRWIVELPGFEGDPKRCNEKILEAIQMAWMQEYV